MASRVKGFALDLVAGELRGVGTQVKLRELLFNGGWAVLADILVRVDLFEVGVNQVLVEHNGRDKLVAAKALHLDTGINHLLKTVEELHVLSRYFNVSFLVLRVP